jgi:SAM-dependent methyltransferase
MGAATLSRASQDHTSVPIASLICRTSLCAVAAVLCIGIAGAWDDDILFERDSPYVPSPPDVVERMLDLVGINPGEFVIDVGSGDGRIAIAAAQRGARAHGVDLNPKLVAESKANAITAGVADRVTFEVRDLFETDLSKADVLTVYLLPLVNLDLRPRILDQMKPGARVVAHQFDMGEWWPDATDLARLRPLFYWVIPAKVGGRWKVESEEDNFTLDIAQTFQRFTAAVHVEKRLLPKIVDAHTTHIHDGRLNGTEISFAVDMGIGPRIYRGRVEGDTIRGILPQGWKAVRVAK